MTVLISQPIPEPGVELLRRHFVVEIPPKHLKKHELVARIRGKDALVCTTNEKIDEEIVAAATDDLKVISTISVGFNHISLQAAAKKGIAVTNTPGTLHQTVAEFVFAHLLCSSRRLIEMDQYVRAGEFKEWHFNLLLGRELRGKTLGIIGFGNIGQTLVPIAQGFGMTIRYVSRKNENVLCYEDNPHILPSDLKGVLRNSDYVVLLVPLTKETMHLISLEELRQMKRVLRGTMTRHPSART